MVLTMHFRINRPKIILETFEDEIVLINLDTGNYYSLDKVGAEIWEFLENGASVSDTIEEIIRRYDGSRMDTESAVRQFVAELQQEGLIVPAALKDTENIQEPKAQAVNKPKTEKVRFESPTLRRYTDMQDLLLLDPIHEVNETGWPITKPHSSLEKE